MTTNTVKFGDNFYLKHATNQYLIAVDRGTYNWPQLGNTGKVTLQLVGNYGELVKSSSRIKIRTTELITGNHNILGAFGDKHNCYYYRDAYNEDKQSWFITKVSGEPDSLICYKDQVYLTNCSYTNQKLCADTSSVGYITTAENTQDWWILESAAPVITEVGPVGSSISATAFSIQPENTTATKIKSIDVWANWAVDKIQVEYENPATNPPTVYFSEAVGGTGGKKSTSFALGAGDYLTSVSGKLGTRISTSSKKEILSIQFHTNQGNQSDVYGGDKSQKQVEEFKLDAPEGSEIIGFFGAYGSEGNVLVQLGIYTRPI